jgi:putative pyruvate formate lyase activating enzyme
MLERKGAENINIVTGTHFLPSLAEGIRESRERGLTKPVVWNSSGYETSEYFPLLNDFVDIYLPDLKTLDSSLSESMFGVSDYPDAATRAIKEMAASRPLLRRGASLVSGLIVRHLVLPGLLENTRAVLAWFAENVADRALLSLMFQYTPPAGSVPRGGLQGGQDEGRGEWERGVSAAEYGQALAMLDEFGIEEGFVQELPEDGTPCLPDFSLPDAFPGGLAQPLWFYGKSQAEGAGEICPQEMSRQETRHQSHQKTRHEKTRDREISDPADSV